MKKPIPSNGLKTPRLVRVIPNAITITALFGSTFDEGLEGRIRVSCVATGIDAHAASLLSKARISELEKEIQASIMKTPEVTSFESSPDLHQEVSAELNFEDREMTFKETDPSFQTPKETLPEDPYRYATPPSEQEEGRSLSLFERLIGRKNQSVRAAPEALKRPFPQAMVQSTFESVSEDEDESIEIPAFLRRQSGR